MAPNSSLIYFFYNINLFINNKNLFITTYSKNLNSPRQDMKRIDYSYYYFYSYKTHFQLSDKEIFNR
jgi:hypothetical protein